jgi:hypothetical protein
MTTPDFWLIGAPKCGSTSLYRWLSAHPDVFMCNPKEPNFFSQDIAVYHRAAHTWDEYRRLFDGASEFLAVGEASTSYSRSRVAVPAIMERLSEARFVFCLRDPAEMIASVHGQMLRSGRENVRDLREAFRLEPRRRLGESLPERTQDPRDYIYSDTCALGSQLSRLYENVDRSRVQLVFMEDLRLEPRKVWRELQEFIGIPDDGRTDFVPENVRAIPRSVVAARGVRALQKVKNRLISGRSIGIGGIVRRVLERSPRTEEKGVSEALRAELVSHFSGEVDKLEHLTGRDLSAWRK